ncbi:glucose-methanol-choline oxidoreductase protein [Rutstroemia sp. NJR-2017a BBW]|nr:glucose-methanol-choline oxidoreductase protein [Rutstroemia sp. NJR-2017a BBW]
MMQVVSKAALLAILAHTSITSALPQATATAASASKKSSTPDYVIVGGGPAGFVLAEQLSRNSSVTVVLLEAGPDTSGVEAIDVPGYAPTLLDTQYTWNYSSQPDSNLNGNAPSLAQGRGFGGGHAVNYLGSCRGAPSVFDEWAKISGDDGLKWSNFFEDFKSTVHFENVALEYDPHVNTSAYGNGPIELTAPNSNLGGFVLDLVSSWMSVLSLPWVDLNDGTGLGVVTGTPTIRASNRTRDYAPQAYGWQMNGRANVQQIHYAQVTKIGFTGKTATSVTYVNPNTQAVTTLKAKEIILSAGALNTPKLLMLSGVGPKAHLKSLNIPVVLDVPQVGQHLQDHHCAFMEFQVTDNIQTLWQTTQNATFQTIANAEYSNAGGANGGPLGVPSGAAFALQRVPDSVFQAVNDTYHPSLPADRGQLLYQYSASTLSAGTPNVSIVSPFVAVSQPEDSGYLHLASSDYRDAPLIYSNYFGSAGDKAAVLWGYKQMRKVFQSSVISPYIVKELYPGTNVTSDADLWTAIQNSALTFHHPVGTVALGTVLEGKTFRVKGLKGLRVVDSSTFPGLTTCHPLATVYALAYHAAQLIKKQDAAEF